MRELSNSAGMYRTSVASFLGKRILAVSACLTLLVLLSLSGRLDARSFFGAAILAVMGWYMPYVRVQRRAAPAPRVRSTARSRSSSTCS